MIILFLLRYYSELKSPVRCPLNINENRQLLFIGKLCFHFSVGFHFSYIDNIEFFGQETGPWWKVSDVFISTSERFLGKTSGNGFLKSAGRKNSQKSRLFSLNNILLLFLSPLPVPPYPTSFLDSSP